MPAPAVFGAARKGSLPAIAASRPLAVPRKMSRRFMCSTSGPRTAAPRESFCIIIKRLPKRFTLAEARSLLPQVGRLIREAVDMKMEYQDAERILQAQSA